MNLFHNEYYLRTDTPRQKVPVVDIYIQRNVITNLKLTPMSDKTLPYAIVDTSVGVFVRPLQINLDIIQGNVDAIQKMIIGRDTVLKRILSKSDVNYNFVLFLAKFIVTKMNWKKSVYLSSQTLISALSPCLT